MARSTIRESHIIKLKAQKIKFLLVDCDGVLSDDKFFFSEKGEEVRKYSSRDVVAVHRLHEAAGIEVGLINENVSDSITEWADMLSIKERFFKTAQKDLLLDEILRKKNLSAEAIAYVGDEINDVPLMEIVGLSACPLDAVYEARSAADYICNSCGGNGVLREVAELIIMAHKELKCCIPSGLSE
jgi:3-deoxy-D-manno-octulosonate 8-phosphate phosphatase (KDO 8-P phosphatase)